MIFFDIPELIGTYTKELLRNKTKIVKLKKILRNDVFQKWSNKFKRKIPRCLTF